MKIAIIGSSGQLGSDIVAFIKKNHNVSAVPLTHRDVEISNLENLEHVLSGVRPDVVVSTAAWHPGGSNGDVASFFATNAVGAYNLAVTCRKLEAELIWFSTDYVFDGKTDRPYVETDPPNPISTYGLSKYAGELLIRNNWERHYIVRVGGLYGQMGCRAKGGTNVVENFIRLGQGDQAIKVNADQYASSTYTVDVAARLLDLLSTRSYGIYHMVNTGVLSWYEFAREVSENAGLSPALLPILMDSRPSEYPRPRYSVLDNAHLRTVGLSEMPPVKDALRRYMAARQKKQVGSLDQ